jgi:hypothetical protein
MAIRAVSQAALLFPVKEKILKGRAIGLSSGFIKMIRREAQRK